MKGAEAEALLFDLGGVLLGIDFSRVLAHWAKVARVPVEQIKTRFDHGLAYQRHERGEIDAGAYFQALRGTLGIDIPDADFAEGWDRVFLDEIAPTVALLPRLAPRIPLYLFSNTNETHRRFWMSRHAGALRPFRRLFVSSEMGLRKPERAAFDFIAREIGLPAEKILFFDDTLENVEGARAAGLPAVLVRSPADVERAVAPWLG